MTFAKTNNPPCRNESPDYYNLSLKLGKSLRPETPTSRLRWEGEKGMEKPAYVVALEKNDPQTLETMQVALYMGGMPALVTGSRAFKE